MPAAIGELLIGALAPELAAAAAAPLSIGGLSLGVSTASLVGGASILASPVGLSRALNLNDGQRE